VWLLTVVQEWGATERIGPMENTSGYFSPIFGIGRIPIPDAYTSPLLPRGWGGDYKEFKSMTCSFGTAVS